MRTERARKWKIAAATEDFCRSITSFSSSTLPVPRRNSFAIAAASVTATFGFGVEGFEDIKHFDAWGRGRQTQGSMKRGVVDGEWLVVAKAKAEAEATNPCDIIFYVCGQWVEHTVNKFGGAQILEARGSGFCDWTWNHFPGRFHRALSEKMKFIRARELEIDKNSHKVWNQRCLHLTDVRRN